MTLDGFGRLWPVVIIFVQQLLGEDYIFD